MKKHIEVSAALIVKEDKFFICQRSETMTLPTMWEFPGGKIEAGETAEVALEREIKEELSCTVVANNLIDSSYYEYDTFSITLSVYNCTLKSGKPELKEHMNSAWITIDEFDNYEFAPADISAINKIKDLYAK